MTDVTPNPERDTPGQERHLIPHGPISEAFLGDGTYGDGFEVEEMQSALTQALQAVGSSYDKSKFQLIAEIPARLIHRFQKDGTTKAVSDDPNAKEQIDPTKLTYKRRAEKIGHFIANYKEEEIMLATATGLFILGKMALKLLEDHKDGKK